MKYLLSLPAVFYQKNAFQCLKHFFLTASQGTIIFSKKPLDQLPINLHLCVNTQSGYLSFENSNEQTMYLLINESGFLSIFIDYIENLNNEYNSYLATPEETADFIKKKLKIRSINKRPFLCNKRKRPFLLYLLCFINSRRAAINTSNSSSVHLSIIRFNSFMRF